MQNYSIIGQFMKNNIFSLKDDMAPYLLTVFGILNMILYE